MLCKVCGAQIPDDAKECEMCGAKTDLEQTDGETKVIDSEEIEQLAENNGKISAEEIFDDNERHRREQMNKMLEDKKNQLSEIERRRNAKRRRQRRNRIILVGLICVLAVSAAGIGAYYVVQNVNSNNTVDTTPLPTATASAALTPLPTEASAVSPSPSVPLETSVPLAAEGTNNQTTGQSWTSTGNNGGSSAASASSSSNKTASSGGSSSSSNRPSSGGSSSSSGSSSASKPSSPSGSSSSSVSMSGVSSSQISSALATGKEVIYNSGTGRYLMTFVIGNTKYYANVSAGSTTEQIKNKPYTITASPTSETYNGNTVFEITNMTNYGGNGYLLPDSGTKLLTNSDIKGMSKYDLALARNEIYARHGRKFRTAEYNEYFSGKEWYTINPNYNYSDDDSNLNEIEVKNVLFLLNAERK